ncbi:hypothetical protein G5714_000160 [Onychostoma macrolepis]|uniref:Ig-like domain-containing protein n=1 Tax=Onychostoma macrolepis TaxID=369639 RepID=A0A7J6DFT7_9TELE|nr:hypothetical protein G5714_000160 [Onychostoma macrolepis]
MKILLIFFTFYLISDAVRCFSVTGYSGGSLLVDSGKLWFTDSAKNMYKLREWRRIKNDGRLLIFHNNKGNLLIFIRELNQQDAGRYRIGVSGMRPEYLNLIVLEDLCCGMSKIIVNRGDNVMISCKYSEKHKNHPKIMFKKEKASIELIYTTETWENKKELSFSNDSEENLFSVRITAVTPDDGGVYLCGVWINRHSYSYSIINTVNLHIVDKYKSATFRVSGYSGGRLMIKCEHPQYKTKPKYICKESAGCSERKNPGVQDEWMENEDVSLYDDTRAGILMVFFRELKAADAGTYRCGVKVSDYTESFTQLQLSVKHDLYCKVSKGEMVNIGETANFSCEYSQNHINDVKIILKEGKDSIEMIYSRWKKKERFSISDDKQKNVFHVRITAVTPDDGGVYLCGVWINRHSYNYSIINTVHLHINMPPVVRHEGESAEIICPYDSIYKSNTKSLCKGKCSTRDRNPLSETVREEKETKTDRLTLKDNVTASVFTGTITGLTAEDAGKYWCAVTLETDLNYLYTHLMVIMNEELNLTKYEGDDVSIQCKHHDEDQKSFCKAHEASMCVKDGVSLETIRDDRFSFSDEASTGVFTVNITDLREEDSGIYWCGAHVITSVNLNVKTDFTLMNMICASSALMLIGGFSLIMCKLKKPRFLLCYIK